MGGKQPEIPGSTVAKSSGRDFFFQIPFLSRPIYVLIGKSSIMGKPWESGGFNGKTIGKP